MVANISHFLISTTLLIAFFLAHNDATAATPSNEREREKVSQLISQYETKIQTLGWGQLVDISWPAVKARSKAAELLLAEAKEIDLTMLPHREQVILRILASRLEIFANEDDSYYLTFSATPYRGGIMLASMPHMLSAQDLSKTDGRESWLGILSTFSDYIHDLDIKHQEQKKRGILLPKKSVLEIRELYNSRAAIANQQLKLAVQTVSTYDPKVVGEFEVRALAVLDTEFIPALNRLVATLDDEYYELAPDRGGLWQYPGGPEHYRWLIKRFISEDIDPEVLFERAQGYVDDLEASMAAIRKEMGFKGSRAEFNRRLWSDPAQRPIDAQDIKDTMLRYTSETSELLPNWFGRIPIAPHSAEPIDPGTAESVDRGYFSPPNSMSNVGVYYFKGFDMPSYIYSDIAHLAAHELIPGHHFQVSLMMESKTLPRVLREGLSGGFIEAWAEYAANLGVEMGVFDTQLERYGILGQTLSMGATAAVVDIGYNYYGWSFEEAEAYLAQHCWGPDCVPGSTSKTFNGSVISATDRPGYILPYHLSYRKILELRARAEKALGENFDIREFHDAVLEYGGIPMDVLEFHIDHFIAERSL
ncbi:MAG: DUF885 domain-containing protein [Gammaproteobacteria bacterium]|jgi:uncharacterized protein (DUF885 family)|nr:DUF885 domain-containing protein [Gammaproteobacteria bacterium]